MNLRDPLKFLIVVYLVLLVIEGALRKWVLPSLSAELLVVRDPVALLIYLVAARRGSLWRTRQMGVWTLLALAIFILGIVQLSLGLPLPVMLFGLRTYLLHWPLVFVMGSCLTYKDVVWIGKWTMLISIPMTLLIVAQFQSSPTADINATAGGSGGVQLHSAMGHVRPAGTFSFVTGPATYYPIATAFLLYGYWRKAYPRWLIMAALLAIIAALPVSGSRSLVLSCALVLVMGLAVGLGGKGSLSVLAQVAVPIVAAFYLLSMFEFFEEGKAVFQSRWDDANAAGGGVEKSIVQRSIDGFLQPFRALAGASVLGEGIGKGTNVGSAYATGRNTFLLGESDWQRIFLEAGLILGVAFIAFRVGIVVEIGLRAFSNMRGGKPFAWLIFAGTAFNTVFGQTGQPTNLGFVVVGAGLALAALKEPAPAIQRVAHPWARQLWIAGARRGRASQ